MGYLEFGIAAKKDGNSIRINVGGIQKNNIRNDNVESDVFKNAKIFKRKLSYTPNDNLTYKRVIERIVKRFLLHYQNSHYDLNEKNAGDQHKQIKNDLSSLSFELFYEIDELSDMRASLAQPMEKLNENLKKIFDFDQIKRHLTKQKNPTK